MQSNVDEMIAGHRVPPESVLDPESAMQQRVVLLGRTQVKPDAPKALHRLQIGAGDVRRIVPQTRPIQSRSIGNQDCQKNCSPSGQISRDRIANGYG